MRRVITRKSYLSSISRERLNKDSIKGLSLAAAYCLSRCMFGLCLAVFLMCGTAQALDFTMDYDIYQQPNKGNNYSDGQGVTVGLQHGIYKDLKGRLDVSHVTDVHFPTHVDVKGSFGELRAYGGTYNLIFELPYNKNVSFNLSAGAGPYWWNFRENPYMQDSQIKVHVDPSLVMKAGAGVDIKIYDKWKVELGVGWLDTSIGKKVVNAGGDVLNLLDADDEINLRYITYKIGIRKEF